MRADLHVHSSASDGTDSPADVMCNAVRAGLDVVALTDHDTAAGIDQARAALPPALTLVAGMELSCHLDGRSVHMLAYLFDPASEELAAETARIRDDRVIRAQAMVAKLACLGAGVTWDQVAQIAGGSVVGRPHIARAMAAAGVVATPEDAFTDEWIADGGRAYVDKYALPPARAIRLINAAGGVAVLAHPRAGRTWSLSDQEIISLAAVGLAGLEVYHPDHPQSERQALLDLAHHLGLIATAGSDYHGSFAANPLGCETSGEETYARLLDLAVSPGR